MTRHPIRLTGVLVLAAGLLAAAGVAAPAQTAGSRSSGSSASGTAVAGTPVAGWPPDPTDATFRADVYPAERWAVRAAGRAAADAVLLLDSASTRDARGRGQAAAAAAAAAAGGGVGDGGGRGGSREPAEPTSPPQPDAADADALRTIAVFVRGEKDDDLWREAAEGLRAGLPAGVNLVRQNGELSPSSRPPAGEAWVGLALRDRRTLRFAWSPRPVSAGRVEAIVVVGTNGSRTVESRYEEKPWAEDFDRFAAAGGEREWLVARTERPCATRDEAERQAIATAASLLEARVPADLLHQYGQAGPTGVHTRALQALGSGRYVADRQVRRYGRAYGDVWDAAILVDASPDTLHELANAARVYHQTRRVERVSAAFAAVVMVVVIGLLYAVVNAITKGYIARRLRVLAVVMLAGALVVGAAMLA